MCDANKSCFLLLFNNGRAKEKQKSASSSAEQRAVKNHFIPVCHPRSTKSQTGERKEIVNFDLKGEKKTRFQSTQPSDTKEAKLHENHERTKPFLRRN